MVKSSNYFQSRYDDKVFEYNPGYYYDYIQVLYFLKAMFFYY